MISQIYRQHFFLNTLKLYEGYCSKYYLYVDLGETEKYFSGTIYLKDIFKSHTIAIWNSNLSKLQLQIIPDNNVTGTV